MDWIVGDAGKPGTLRNRTERNGTEPEVTDAQYGRDFRFWAQFIQKPVKHRVTQSNFNP